MGLVSKWTSRLVARVRASRLRAKIVAAGLGVVLLAGAGWLVAELGSSPEPLVPLTAGPMEAADLAAAADLADEWGIDHRIEDFRLLVEPGRRDRLRAALRDSGRAGGDGALTFEQLAAETDIWATQAQHAQRWQAAKMAELGRLISDFPPVRRATVIIEPGSGPGLGRCATKPRAAVHIDLASGSRVTGRLVEAVADLVSGSVLGMDAADVRIVDSTGRSYRAGEPIAADAEDLARMRRQAEEYFAARAREAAAYVAGAIVSVSVECDPGGDANDQAPGRCVSASVWVPRSYLAEAYRTRTGGAADVGDAEWDAVAADILRRLRRGVATAVGLASADGEAPEAVRADWYYDVSPPPGGGRLAAVRQAPGAPDGGAAKEETADSEQVGARAGASGLLVGLGLCCAVIAWVRGRRVRRPGPDAAPSDVGDGKEAAAHGGSAEAADPLARLGAMGARQIAAMLADEHPQTQALVLSRVSAATAAEALDALGAERQVEVTRRIAALAAVDPVVAAEAIRGLIEQWSLSAAMADSSEGPASDGETDDAEGQTLAAPAGGVSAAARILNCAGGTTEQAVLDGLSGVAPALAESIRKRMFVFDDVALLPRTVLRAALDSLGRDELAIALRTAAPAVTEKVLGSLGRHAAGKVRREMERIGPVRLSDVEAAQERVVSAVRRLEDATYASGTGRKQSEVIA